MSSHQEGNRARSALKGGLLIALLAVAGGVALYHHTNPHNDDLSSRR